uniref:Uncharacterized protein n=1 Tax=Anguilla anguilla TaxID=7936 RepID=A0A0E9TAS3_ANGAN
MMSSCVAYCSGACCSSDQSQKDLGALLKMSGPPLPSSLLRI